jgi:hypothetical protein
MTTERQKKSERRYVDQFGKGHADWLEIVEGEKPDFRIQRASGGDIGLEVVEYHADSQDVPGQKRVAVEARWWNQLWPALDKERRSMDSLRGVGVHLGFNKARMPQKRDHEALVRELLQIAEIAAPVDANIAVEVEFRPLTTIEQAIRFMPDCHFLAAEGFPLASESLSHLSVTSWPIDGWPPWVCSNAASAWLGADESEFARILESKAKKSQNYDLVGAELWLLVVCETFGDLESHIFPKSEEDVAALEETIRETGFDFATSPFAQVWLLSAFTGSHRRIHPFYDG